MIEIIVRVKVDEVGDAGKRSPKRIKSEPETLDWLGDVLYLGTTAPPEDTIDMNIEKYMAEPSCLSIEDPLIGWKDRRNVYPTLSRVARKYLAIPASSVSSERIFSLAGNLVTKKSALLSPNNIDMLIFLIKNRILDSPNFCWE